MKRLFNDKDNWSDEANALQHEATLLLKPLIEKYQNLGFSVREIDYVLSNAISMECVHVLIMAQVAQRNLEKENKAKIAACPDSIYHQTHMYCPTCPWIHEDK